MGLTTTPGFGPQKLEGANSFSGSLVAFPMETYETAVLDLTVPNLGIEMIPARPGHIAIPNNMKFVLESTSGVQVNPPLIQIGSDAAHVNYVTAATQAISNADQSSATPPSIVSSFGFNAFSTGLQMPPGVPVYADITAASGTGGFALKARLFIVVYWYNAENA